MIASFFDGRVRLRSDGLKDPEVMASVKDLVADREGVLEIHGNLATGSLLILYDPQIISREDLCMAAEFLSRELPVKRKRPKQPPAGNAAVLARRRESVVIAAIYCLTILSGFVSRRMHLIAGATLTVMTAKHLYDRKNKIGL